MKFSIAATIEIDTTAFANAQGCLPALARRELAREVALALNGIDAVRQARGSVTIRRLGGEPIPGCEPQWPPPPARSLYEHICRDRDGEWA